MTDIKKIAEMLQDNEIVVLKSFKKKSADRIREIKSLKPIEFLRAGMWLENKGLIKTTKIKKKFATLDILGKRYVKASLPEIKLIALLKKGPKTLEQLRRFLSADELRFALGYLKKRSAININKGVLSITSYGRSTKITLEGKFLLILAQKGELALDNIEPQDLHAYLELKKRKQLVKEVEKQEISFKITELGKQVAENVPSGRRIGLITPAIIRSGDWKKQPFRRYDVEAGVPAIYPGKKQPYLAFLDDARAKLVELGFKEMNGPLIETEFWHFDALFQPQNHPAREWTDTYTLKYPKQGDLPKNKKQLAAVKKSHEGSWLYSWNPEKARQLTPRAHGTALSARWLGQGCQDGKYFAIARCYRPDVIDATHAIEFNQVEGIVVGDGLTFRNLLGTLKQFAIEFAGADKVRFLPDYYPFTEPSVQLDAHHPEMGWIELGGAGIFRPELTNPLGCKKPVIAWGLGIDRLAMFKLGIKDIRYLFSTNIDWLRKEKVV